MSAVALADFQETLAVIARHHRQHKGLRKRIRRVLACAGESGDCNEWTGWFFLELDNGDIAYLTGGCDTSGWGCQDWVTSHVFGGIADPVLLAQGRESVVRVIMALGRILADEDTTSLPDAEWDFDPVDLNRWLATGEEPPE
jgi:hypothetical protein